MRSASDDETPGFWGNTTAVATNDIFAAFTSSGTSATQVTVNGFNVASHLPAIESALSPGMQSLPFAVRSSAEIEEAIDRLGSDPNSALIVLGGPLTALHRDLIAIMGAKHRLPTVSPYRYFAAAGGLLSYGPDTVDQYRLAASYVDRILKGEKPADLPVQFPTKYNLVINLKTARMLGLNIPPMLLARADEVIE
jgi:putative ABC transport system substrate-binding protein